MERGEYSGGIVKALCINGSSAAFQWVTLKPFKSFFFSSLPVGHLLNDETIASNGVFGTFVLVWIDQI